MFKGAIFAKQQCSRDGVLHTLKQMEELSRGHAAIAARVHRPACTEKQQHSHSSNSLSVPGTHSAHAKERSERAQSAAASQHNTLPNTFPAKPIL